MADVFMGNCYRVFLHNRPIAIFGCIENVDEYVRLQLKQYEWLKVEDFRTELAFIEGIGF